MAREDAVQENEYSELEEKELKAVSGGCGSSTPEPEPTVNPYDCPSGGVHTPNSALILSATEIRSTCTKCGQSIVSDDRGEHWKSSQDAAMRL